MGGYNDNLATFIQVVMQKARELRVKPDRLAVMKEQVVKYSVKSIQQLYSLSSRLQENGATFSLDNHIRYQITLDVICYPKDNGPLKNNWQNFHVCILFCFPQWRLIYFSYNNRGDSFACQKVSFECTFENASYREYL